MPPANNRLRHELWIGQPRILFLQMMVKEAEAQRKQRERNFAVLRALKMPVEPAVQGPVIQGVQVQARIRLAGRVNGLMFMLEQAEPQTREEECKGERDEDLEEEKPVVHPVNVGVHQLVVARENFDLWMFRGRATSDHRQTLKRLLESKVEGADANIRLSESQKAKLRLAGQGDIKRLFDQIEEKRREFERVRTDWARCQEFASDLQPLSLVARSGPFGDDSLFAKTLRKILADEMQKQSNAKNKQ